MKKYSFGIILLCCFQTNITAQIPAGNIEKEGLIRDGLYDFLKPGVYYTVAPLNVRLEPALDAQIIGQLKLHERIEIIGSALIIQNIDAMWSDWYKIKYGSNFGYIWGGYIAYKTIIFDIDGNGLNDYFQFRCNDVQAYSAFINPAHDIFIYINNEKIALSNIKPGNYHQCDFIANENGVVIKLGRRIGHLFEETLYTVNESGEILFLEHHERAYGP